MFLTLQRERYNWHQTSHFLYENPVTLLTHKRLNYQEPLPQIPNLFYPRNTNLTFALRRRVRRFWIRESAALPHAHDPNVIGMPAGINAAGVNAAVVAIPVGVLPTLVRAPSPYVPLVSANRPVISAGWGNFAWKKPYHSVPTKVFINFNPRL